MPCDKGTNFGQSHGGSKEKVIENAFGSEGGFIYNLRPGWCLY
jgi:hypothetical protein